MKDEKVVVRQKTLMEDKVLDADAIITRVSSLLPGISGGAGGQVTISVPPYRIRKDEDSWQDLLGDSTFQQKRLGLARHIEAVLSLNEYAKEKGFSLADAARERAELLRKTLEHAWVALLAQNRRKEESVRYLALFFSNMQDSVAAFRNKIFVIDATAREIASDVGRFALAEELSRYVDRPDPRQSRAYLIVQDWVGSPAALHRLGRVVHDHRAVLISDAPSYDSMEKLQTSSAEGAILESLPGQEVFHRHMVLLGNRGRVRERFKGRYAEEKSDVFVPASGPWFGMYLDNIARGMPWKPAVGYQNPIVGFDDVMLDLRLSERDGYTLYLDHRINPCIHLAAGSSKIVVWGPDALSKVDGGVQIGVAIVENIIVRYAEWILNQYGLFDEMEKAQDVVREKLSRFMVANSGAGRMFRSGSRVEVTADEKSKTLEVEFQLLFREIVEKVVIRLSKPRKREALADVTATSAPA